MAGAARTTPSAREPAATPRHPPGPGHAASAPRAERAVQPQPRLAAHESGRRQALAGLSAAAAAPLLPRRAAALTVEDVQPAVAPAQPLTAMETAIIDVFERTTYSVVNIIDNTLQGAPRMAQVDQPEGNGTGFVWDTDGHIVTNYHVLASALQRLGGRRQGDRPPKVAKVTLLGRDGISQTFDGYLVGADRSKDLAVLSTDAPRERLQPVEVGSSKGLRVGQQVLCIGNPFGFDHTLTTGVVSGMGREIQSRAGVLIGGGIQTDAAINPGNSGGPLLDSRGRVIGVNTAIFTNTGTSAGVGFAIPVDAVAQAVGQLIGYGRIIRPSLRIQVADDRVAASLGVREGALVQSVDASSSAGQAGLRGTRRTLAGVAAGDVIVGIDGTRVGSPGDLSQALDARSIGDKARLRVRRGSEELSLDISLQEELS